MKLYLNNRSTERGNLELLTKQVAKGGIIAVIGASIIKVTVFGLHILLARVLDPPGYGLYALGISVTNIARSVASLGLNQGVVRYGSIYKGESNNSKIKGTIVSALGLSLLSSILIALLLFSFAGFISERFFHDPCLAGILKVFALALPFYVFTGITSSFAQSFKRIEYQQGINIFFSLANLSLVGLAFLFGFRLAGAICGFLTSAILSAGLGFYSVCKIFPEISKSFSHNFQIKPLLRFSIPIFLIGFSYLLLTYTDRIMLGYFEKASGVGVYNAAAVVSMQMTFFLSAFIAIFSPTIADLHNRGEKPELIKLFKIVTRWVTFLSLPIFFILVLHAKNIMWLFGPDFVTGNIVLMILCTAQLVNIITGPAGMLLQMTGKQDLEFYNGLILLLINIGLNIWLIPIYGIIGASIATSFSLIAIHGLRLFEASIIYRMLPYDRRYFITLCGGLIALLVGLALTTAIPGFLPWSLICSFGAIFTYVSIIFMLGLDEEDRHVFRMLKKTATQAINP